MTDIFAEINAKPEMQQYKRAYQEFRELIDNGRYKEAMEFHNGNGWATVFIPDIGQTAKDYLTLRTALGEKVTNLFLSTLQLRKSLMPETKNLSIEELTRS